MSKLSISCIIAEPRWQALAPLEGLCRRSFKACLAPLALSPPLGVGVLFSNDKHLHELNLRFCGKAKPTNVLSFPNENQNFPPCNEACYLGDIALSYDTVQREAAQEDKKLLAHASHMLIHGFLHLAGFDHQTEEQAGKMEELEIKILESLNFANPYLEKANQENKAQS